MRRHFFFTVLVSLIPSIALAINLNLNYPEFGGFNLNDPNQQDLPSIVAWFYVAIVSLAGLAAFVMLVVGGFRWLVSAGNPNKISEAKDTITKALLGLLLVLASFIIINFINPELTSSLQVALSNVCDDPVNAAKCKGAFGNQEPGVFLCENVECKGKYIFIDPTISGCREIADFTNIDLATCDPEGKSTAGTNNWNDETSAVKFGSRQWNVVLSEDINFGKRAICLQSSIFDLTKYQMGQNIVLGPVSWNDKVSAMRIVPAGQNTSCATHGITLPDKDEAPLGSNEQPVVFFFNKKQFDIPGQFIKGFPLSSWAPGEGPPPSPDTDEYLAGRSHEIGSIWIDTAKRCPNNPKDSQCAVFVSNDSAVPITPGAPGTYMCFKNSVIDTSERDPITGDYKYSFRCNGNVPIGKEIGNVMVIAERWCTNPGVVETCT